MALNAHTQIHMREPDRQTETVTEREEMAQNKICDALVIYS